MCFQASHCAFVDPSISNAASPRSSASSIRSNYNSTVRSDSPESLHRSGLVSNRSSLDQPSRPHRPSSLSKVSSISAVSENTANADASTFADNRSFYNDDAPLSPSLTLNNSIDRIVFESKPSSLFSPNSAVRRFGAAERCQVSLNDTDASPDVTISRVELKRPPRAKSVSAFFFLLVFYLIDLFMFWLVPFRCFN